MKKKVSVAVLLILLASLLTGCASEPFTCFVCGNEVEGKKYKGQLFGEEISICQNCNETMNSLNKALSESSK